MAAINALIAILSYAIALCGVVPLFPWLSTAPRLLLAAGLAAGIWQSLRGAWTLKNWALNLTVFPFFIYYASRLGASNVVQPVVDMLAVMMAVRLVGEKNSRHHLQTMALSLFCLATSSLFDLSPLFVVYLALLLVLIAVSLVLLTFQDQGSRMFLSRRDLRPVLAVGVSLPLFSVPLLLLFFPLLPRTPFPLWNISGGAPAGSTGYSDKVEPGRSAEVTTSSLLAFRAELPRQPNPALYWRQTVFNRFERGRWIRDSGVPPEAPVYGFPRVTQLIYPEPGSARFLVALDTPAIVTGHGIRTNQDSTAQFSVTGDKRQSYRVDSFAGGVLPVKGEINRAFYLALPTGIPPRILRLVGELNAKGNNDADRAELLERFFRNGGYRYGMRGLPTGPRALERFLFNEKQGNCEFFASAFTLLARATGIPARLVGGYLGGEYNDIGEYYAVTQGMAHVWTELFIDGRGWQRVDPSSFALNADAVWAFTRQLTMTQRLRMALDSLDHAWNRSVVSYDFERQVDTARGAALRLQSLAPERISGSRMAVIVISTMVLLALIGLVKRRTLFPAREERLLRGFFRRLERDCGIQTERRRRGLFDLARLSANERVDEFVAVYTGALYRDRALTDEEYERLRRLVRAGFRDGTKSKR